MRALLTKSAAGGGGSSPTISLHNQSGSDTEAGPAVVDYSVYTSGSVAVGGTVVENWISDSTQSANYEIQAVLSSGSTPIGTLGSYLALSSDRSWSLSNVAQNGSTKACVLTVTIRKIGTTTVLATATVTLQATSNPIGGGGGGGP